MRLHDAVTGADPLTPSCDVAAPFAVSTDPAGSPLAMFCLATPCRTW